MENSIWTYRSDSGYQPDTDLAGYAVEATDGQIGKVQEHNDAEGTSHIVVDTGSPAADEHILLPAGSIRAIDPMERVVHLDHTEEEIKNAPEFDRDQPGSESDAHHRIGAYYAARLTP
ncbi:hypothetical protein [Streptacidiphilus neutrinimicus]|uniref:hypothetical protein n=1 Tax=Streptacidiphilus neutrinimicus TaxID=105420 RepID=UPI0005A7DFA0|nr:hypothetical protein [Streptacidiphilus neutrinimicus]